MDDIHSEIQFEENGQHVLDPRLLRAFIGILDTGSFTRAAEQLHLTQSTISQQLARLEETVGHALIDREARPISATASGERLQGYARRILTLQQEAQAALGDPAGLTAIRIGLAEDIFDGPMAALFREFAQGRREIRMDVTSGLSRDLTRRYRDGEFDIAVVKEPAPSADARASFPEPMAWLEAVDSDRDWPDPMPLVVFSPGGLYRDQMFERIERERRRWYVAFSSSSLLNILVAVEAGFGITLLPVATTPGRRVKTYAPFGTEPPIAVSIYSWEQTGPVKELVDWMSAMLGLRASATNAIIQG
ncbi:LysR family transcriptional regulator [Aminobacter sp. NyZ550]|uniref:LysR family transcriptional regulator n=1 Tax=Aminobacter sp. NyZ550 TaxID=2979870 RepID=UPI0021D5E45A|nr:LysR family transcriptional regulator [Aminobacter sp. NyZ550]WAX96295.1 LysR family transcriptional regulator [Aminobacter sp. NyZ550]